MTAPVISFLIALLIVFWMVRYRPAWLPMDHPNVRSLHQHPVPRAGGLAVMIGATVGWSLASTSELAWAGPAIGLALISWLDDRYDLAIGFRLIAQSFAALIFVWLIPWDLSWPLALAAILAIVWVANLYNFMDGADGLAGGMTLVGFGAYAIAAGMTGDASLMTSASCVSAGVIAFMLFNVSPAKIFMGDVGAVPLGFLAGAWGVLGWMQGHWPVWFPVLVFSPFIVDATTTLARRILRKDRFWEAHREHAYQRLVRMGWPHGRLLTAEIVLMVGASSTAIALLHAPKAAQVVAFVVWLGLYLVLLILIERQWRSYLVRTA